MYPLAIVILSLIVTVVYIMFTTLGLFKIQSKLVRILWILCTGLIVGLLYLNIAYTQPDPEDYDLDHDSIQMHIHFDVETAIPNMLSSALLLTNSVLAGVLFIARWTVIRFQVETLCWLCISLLFALGAIDEWFSPESVHNVEVVTIAYVVAGMIAALCLLYLWWRNREKSYSWHYLWVIGGLGMIGVGALFVDRIYFQSIRPGNVVMLEELLELLGSLTLCVTLLELVDYLLPRKIWHTLQFSLIVGVFFLTSAIVGSLFRSERLSGMITYMLDHIEEDDTVFGDNLLSLIGISLPETIYHSSDLLQGNLYFRLERPATDIYSFSAHLLSLPEYESVAQQDEINLGNKPTSAWKLNTIFQQPVLLSIPAVEEASAFALMIRLWATTEDDLTDDVWEEWDDITDGLSVNNSSHQILNDEQDSIVLKQIIAVPSNDTVSLTGETVQFANGMKLITTGEQMTVKAGEKLSLQFQWSTEQPVSDRLIQVLHMNHVSSDRTVIYDAPPFEGRVPTSIWVPDFRAIDTVDLQLPDDLPVGEYELVSGLYNARTMERVGIIDNQTDNLVILQTIVVEE